MPNLRFPAKSSQVLANEGFRSPGEPPSINEAIGSQDFADEQRGLLELVDKLQFAKLDNVQLPQIAVVGDQSAGKSSVLEAITGTPFPKDAGACTRFATEIRLRRTEDPGIDVHIIPDASRRSFAEQERLQQFGASVDQNMDFGTLMRMAVDQIAPKNIPGRFVAGDILVVEKTGPDMPLLTVVDLPGLVRNANNDQSSEDINAINDLTDRYMSNPRTIVLIVIGGNQDYVQAPVLSKAREFDPSGSRTIGVLTKPDLIESIGLEDKFIGLVKNQDKLNNFGLGWYVLLNPGPRELGQGWPDREQREEVEEGFFSRGKWSTLPRTICGVAPLRQKLSVQLQHHIKSHVAALRKEIQTAQEECETEIKELGEGKDTIEEMKEELLRFCSNTKDLVTMAVHGYYNNPPGDVFFPRTVDQSGTPPQKLRARTVEANRVFAEQLRNHGHRFDFSNQSQSHEESTDASKRMDKQAFARDEVEPLMQQNKGTEFPMDHNPRIVYTLFQSHSEDWAAIANEHKQHLEGICHEFLDQVIDHVWPLRMRQPLRLEFLEPQMKNVMQEAQAQLNLLLLDLHLEIQPYDPEYEDRLTAWRVDKSGNGAKFTEAEEVLEKMLIYYDLTAKTFIRNVITQVVERHLLQGLQSIFSWIKINRLDEAMIVAITAEDRSVRDKRLSLKVKKAAIEDAAKLCANLSTYKISTPEISPTKNARTPDERVVDQGHSEASADQRYSSPVSTPTRTQQRGLRNTPRASPFTPSSKFRDQSPFGERLTPKLTDVDTGETSTAVHSIASAFGSPVSRNQSPQRGLLGKVQA